MCDTNGASHFPIQREWAWYNQERIKGVKPFEMGLGRNEGGWEFNTAHFIEDTYYDDDLGEDVTYFRKRSATEANALLSGGTADFKSTPFFGWFEDRTICTNTFLAESTISPQLRAQLLADAISRTRSPPSRCQQGWLPCRNGRAIRLPRIKIWPPALRDR